MREDEFMEVPVKNKEALDPKDTYRVSKLKFQIAIWTAAFSFMGLVVTSTAPSIAEYFTSQQKIIEKKADEQQKVQRILDSINTVQGKIAVKQTFDNMARIYENMSRLQRMLPYSASIAIYSTHDSGGIPRSGSPLHVTVLYQSNNETIPSGKDYWQQKVMPEGYFQLARNIYERGEFYMEDVQNYPAIYNAETKEDMDFNGIRSIYGKLIKITPAAVYYIAVSYKEPNPIQTFNPNVRNIIRVYASKFEKLIQSNSEL